MGRRAPKTTLGVCSPVHFWVQCTAAILASNSAFLTGKALVGSAAKTPNTLQPNLAPLSDLATRVTHAMLVPSEPHSIDPYRVSEMAIFHGTCSLGHLPGGPRERSDMRERGIRSKEPAWNRLSFGSFAATLGRTLGVGFYPRKPRYFTIGSLSFVRL